MKPWLFALLVLIVSCSKNEQPRCWTCEEYTYSVDSNRALVREELRPGLVQYCGKTQTEMEEIMRNYSYAVREVIYDKPVTTQHTLQCKLQYGVQ